MSRLIRGQKKHRLSRCRRNDSGIILIVAVWMIAILSMMAIGLSRGLSVDLALVKHIVRDMHARFAARSAVVYAMDHHGSKDMLLWDAAYPCGYLSDDGGDDLMSGISLGEYAEFDFIIPHEEQRYGVLDLAGRLNLNALDGRTYIIFAQLLVLQADMNESDAHDLALAVVDWVDEDNAVTTTLLGSGAEQEEYDNTVTSLRVKNRPLSNVEELLMVRGMTPEILNEINPYVAAYMSPESPWLLFNLNMADPVLLAAIALSFPNVNESAVYLMIEQLDQYRRGDDGAYCTPDDQSLVQDHDFLERLSQSEQVVYRNLQSLRQDGEADFLTFRAVGRDVVSGHTALADVVLDLTQKRVAQWKRVP